MHMQMIMLPFLLALRSFGLPFRVLLDYHLERGWMPLHGAVGVNCISGAITENQYAGASYMDDRVGVI